MVRTQIYLTAHEHARLKSLSCRSGKKQSELIREAVDRLIESTAPVDRSILFKQGFGLWKERTDLQDFKDLRKSWNRES